jgi:uncharacterized membrane protein
LTSTRRAFQILGVASLLGLVALGLAWELWLAPLRPGGSWLVLKVVPLLFPLRGLLHGKRYTFQWTSMLALLYVLEAATRLVVEQGMAAGLAAAELALALMLFVAAVGFVRSSIVKLVRRRNSA